MMEQVTIRTYQNELQIISLEARAVDLALVANK